MTSYSNLTLLPSTLYFRARAEQSGLSHTASINGGTRAFPRDPTLLSWEFQGAKAGATATGHGLVLSSDQLPSRTAVLWISPTRPPQVPPMLINSQGPIPALMR